MFNKVASKTALAAGVSAVIFGTLAGVTAPVAAAKPPVGEEIHGKCHSFGVDEDDHLTMDGQTVTDFWGLENEEVELSSSPPVHKTITQKPPPAPDSGWPPLVQVLVDEEGGVHPIDSNKIIANCEI